MMKKIFAILLAMSMVLASTVAFAAEPVAESVNPKVTILATNVMDGDMDDGLGERTFAIIEAALTLPEGLLGISKNSMTGAFSKGTGIASFGLSVAFDEDMFDMTTSYIIQAESVGSAAYNATDNAMNGGMSGDKASMYVGQLAPIYTFYMALKDTDATVDSINATAFAEVKLAEMIIDTYSNSSTIQYSTKYSSNSADGTRNFDFPYQVGNGKPEDVIVNDETPVESTITVDGKQEKVKVWEDVSVSAGLVGTGKIKAVLTNTQTSETQDVALTFAQEFTGDNDVVFDVIVKFLDYANAPYVNLEIVKVTE